MNNVTLMGRLVKAPSTKFPEKEDDIAVSNFTLAVNERVGNREETAFIRCVCFGKMAEFAESYFYKGLKIVVSGRLVTGSYVNKDGHKVYTTDVVVSRQEFAEKKAA